MKELSIFLTLLVIIMANNTSAQQFDMEKMREQFEKRHPALDSMISNPLATGMNFDQVFATTDDGIKIAGWFIAGNKMKGTVLMVHGFNMNKSHMIERAKFFNELDLSVLLIDLRARGESGGAKTSTGVSNGLDILAMSELYYSQYSTYGELTFYGFSHGGRGVLFAASKSKKEEALILESPPYSLTESFRRTYKIPDFPKMNEQGLTDAMTKLGDRIILLLIGDSDFTINESEAKELLSYSNSPKSRLVIFVNTGHNVFSEENMDEYKKEINSFFE